MATRRVAAKKTRSVRAETFGSREDFKKSSKKGGSEALGKMAYIPEDPIIVRFLQEPEDWVGYYEHYMGADAEIRYLPCTESDCCEEADGNPSYRYLANALVVDDRKGGQVKALKVPKGLGEHLGKLSAKYGTLLDRDYELSREGSGLDTKYMAVPESPSRMNLERHQRKMFDLLDLLEELATGSPSGDDDDDIDKELKKEARRQGRRYEDLDDDKPSSRSRSKGRGRPAKTRDEDVWDDEDDEDDEEEDVAFTPKRRATPKKTTAKKTVARKAAPKSTSTTRRTIKRR